MRFLIFLLPLSRENRIFLVCHDISSHARDRLADNLLSISSNPWNYTLCCRQDLSDNSEQGLLKIRWVFKADSPFSFMHIWRNLYTVILLFSFDALHMLFTLFTILFTELLKMYCNRASFSQCNRCLACFNH